MSEPVSRTPIVTDEMIMPPKNGRLDGGFGSILRTAMMESGKNIRNFYEDRITDGTLIRSDDLLEWLDAEIALTNKSLFESRGLGTESLESMLATYRAVRAHITGEP